MFLDPRAAPALPLARPEPAPCAPPAPAFGVDNDYGRLRSVLLGDPRHLALVPCNSVSCESVRDGRAATPERAIRQHAALAGALRDEGVTVYKVPAVPALPDLAFTRDAGLMTPWGLIGLRPGASHRAAEVDLALAAARAVGVPQFGRISEGRIEGGDVTLLRPGLVLIGISGERTDDAGAAALAAIFRARGWEVLTYRFDPHFLHLDTQFCLADRDLALACTDVLDDCLLAQLEARGIALVPAAYKEARRLGCNLLALGDRRVLTDGACTRLNAALVRRDYRVISVDLSEFTQCGGGVHCLTLPLGRAPG